MSKRRGRDRVREGKRYLRLAVGAFCLTVDTHSGRLCSFGHADPAVQSRHAKDQVTGWAVAVLGKYGFVPSDPLHVRDAIWGR